MAKADCTMHISPKWWFGSAMMLLCAIELLTKSVPQKALDFVFKHGMKYEVK